MTEKLEPFDLQTAIAEPERVRLAADLAVKYQAVQWLATEFVALLNFDRWTIRPMNELRLVAKPKRVMVQRFEADSYGFYMAVVGTDTYRRYAEAVAWHKVGEPQPYEY